MGKITKLTISTIILTLIILFSTYLLSISIIIESLLAIIIGILFWLTLKKDPASKEIIFSTSILVLFFSLLFYGAIKLFSFSQTAMQQNIQGVLSLISPTPFWIIPIYFVGINIMNIIKIKKKNSNTMN